MAFNVVKRADQWIVVDHDNGAVVGVFHEQRAAVMAAEHQTRRQVALWAAEKAAQYRKDQELPNPPLAQRGFGI